MNRLGANIDEHRGRTRTPDHETSVEGAASVAYRAGSQKDRLLTQYALASPFGLTDEEAAMAADLMGSCYWKRCNELRQDRKIIPVVGSDGKTYTRKGAAGVSRIVCAVT
jgi:hypothetical protein